jgi:hypothetical protein
MWKELWDIIMSFLHKSNDSATTLPILPNNTPIAATKFTVQGDTEVAIKSDNTPEVRVGIERGSEQNAYTMRRRVKMIDPDVYVVANPYQSIMNAIAKQRHVWGSPGERHWAEIIIPPGVHALSAPIDTDWAQNFCLLGHGCGGDDLTPFATGTATTELIAPSSGWAIRVLKSGSGQNAAGPRIENIGITSNNGAGGGIYYERTGRIQIRNVRVYGFTSGYGIYGTRWRDTGVYNVNDGLGAGDTDYGCFDRVIIGECKYGVRMNGADATINHTLICNGNNGNDLIANSIGFWEGIGSNRTTGLLIQGFDTLLQSDEDQPSHHTGLRLEYFYSYGIRVSLGSSTNHGWKADIQSLNNSLGWTNFGATADVGIQFEAGVKNCYATTRHMAASNPAKIRNAGNTAYHIIGAQDAGGYGTSASNTIYYLNN